MEPDSESVPALAEGVMQLSGPVCFFVLNVIHLSLGSFVDNCLHITSHFTVLQFIEPFRVVPIISNISIFMPPILKLYAVLFSSLGQVSHITSVFNSL